MKADQIVDELTSWCDNRGIDLMRCQLGTDGARNFTGFRSGVATQLKAKSPYLVHFNCVCHREALAMTDACKNVRYLNDIFQPALGGVFRYFNNSPVLEASLHSIQALLDEAQTHLKEPKLFVDCLMRQQLEHLSHP